MSPLPGNSSNLYIFIFIWNYFESIYNPKKLFVARAFHNGIK